jgi:hypothetical protein
MRRYMCDKCTELDKKITHFEDLAARLLDPQTVEAVTKFIEDLRAQKAQLHPEQQK